VAEQQISEGSEPPPVSPGPPPPPVDALTGPLAHFSIGEDGKIRQVVRFDRPWDADLATARPAPRRRARARTVIASALRRAAHRLDPLEHPW
jgi:hypothetical protein